MNPRLRKGFLVGQTDDPRRQFVDLSCRFLLYSKFQTCLRVSIGIGDTPCFYRLEMGVVVYIE